MNQHIETLICAAVAAAAEANDASQQVRELEERFQALSRGRASPQRLADVAAAVARALEASSHAQQRAAGAYRVLAEVLPEGMTVKQWLAQKEAPS